MKWHRSLNPFRGGMHGPRTSYTAHSATRIMYHIRESALHGWRLSRTSSATVALTDVEMGYFPTLRAAKAVAEHHAGAAA